MSSVSEYVRYWQETERLCVSPRLQGAESAYRPLDLATLFSIVSSKIAIDSFDGVLGKYIIFFTSLACGLFRDDHWGPLIIKK